MFRWATSPPFSSQDKLCLPHHILEERGLVKVGATVQALLELPPSRTPPTPLAPVWPQLTLGSIGRRLEGGGAWEWEGGRSAGGRGVAGDWDRRVASGEEPLPLPASWYDVCPPTPHSHSHSLPPEDVRAAVATDGQTCNSLCHYRPPTEWPWGLITTSFFTPPPSTNCSFLFKLLKSIFFLLLVAQHAGQPNRDNFNLTMFFF